MSDDMKKPMGEKKPFRGNGERKFGENKTSGGYKGRFDSKKAEFRGERKHDGERKPFSGDKPAFRGEKKFDGEKKEFRGERKPFSGDKPAFRGEKKFDGERKPFSGERKPAFRSDKPLNRDRRGDFRPVRREEPKTAPTDGLPARRIALAVIREVTENGAYASLVLDEKLTKSGLSMADRRLVSRLVYDTLENLIRLDHALNQVMAKPDTDIKLRNILRLGACQILLEDRIPESAATNTCVNLCKEIGMEGLAGVCNGILRNLIRKKDELAWPDEEENLTRALSVRHSMPEWLVERLISDWGREEAEAIMAYKQPETAITVRPNLMEMDDEAFEALLNKKVWEHEKGAVPHSWKIRGMADIGQDADFLGGKFSIQGESSMMAAMAVAPKRGAQLLDACAAPGGKTCLLAELMGGTGRVQAWEMHEHRTALITAQMKRLHLENVRPMTRDASKPREELIESMDAVLLDAPCSGLGVMHDKPDVKMRATAERVAELVQIQKNLLDAVAPYVKKGGTLVYSTCSVLKDENIRQAEAFLNRHPEFELVKLPESIPAQFRQYEETGLQLMPQRDGVGGFYICRMRRKRI